MVSSDDARRLHTLKYGIEERDKFLPQRRAQFSEAGLHGDS
jgi:hypothetical protein